MKFPFGKHKDKELQEIPDTYLDWLIGQDWFLVDERNKKLIEAIGYEMKNRAASGEQDIKSLCDCEYIGKCIGDPQKVDYCPLERVRDGVQ